MYNSAILLKDMTLKIGRGTAYDHIIAYSHLAFLVINVEAMIDYLAARKFWHAKRYFNTMSCTVYDSICTIL